LNEIAPPRQLNRSAAVTYRRRSTCKDYAPVAIE
jgi:hypothetical protein